MFPCAIVLRIVRYFVRLRIRWVSRMTKNPMSSVDLKATMATAIMRFTGQRRYRNDERYLKLWMRYVSQKLRVCVN